MALSGSGGAAVDGRSRHRFRWCSSRKAGGGNVGDAYDNAMCESFFAALECEMLARRRFAS
jgi:hypothetical protein